MSGAPLPPWLAAQRDLLLAQRGHAWLLQGPSGLGQYALAMELVRAWLCDQPGPTGACGQCPSCHGIDVRAHPDLCVLLPETQMLALGWPLPEKAQAEIDDKKRKPSREIRVDALRDAVEFAQRTAGRGRGKAVLVYPAEQMNHVSANALLKTLEEPAGPVRFVLATEAVHQLLPTIRSRCIAHTMRWPEPAEARHWLQAQGVDARDAEIALRLVGGRPEDALALASQPGAAAALARLPQRLAQGDASALADCPGEQAVALLQRVCHDAMALAVGAPPRFFEADAFPRTPALAGLVRWSKALAQEARHADHPFQPGLMAEALVAQARNALHSKA